MADKIKMPSSVVVFHIYQRLVASVKILPNKIPSWGRLSGGGASLALTYLSWEMEEMPLGKWKMVAISAVLR